MTLAFGQGWAGKDKEAGKDWLHSRVRRALETSEEDKDFMLQNNRVPKEPSGRREEMAFQAGLDGCIECKSLVEKLKEAVSNPQVMDTVEEELKTLCSFVGNYADECRRTVDNLPVILHKIQPLLQNPTLFCELLHLCGNTKLASTNRLLFLLFKRVFVNTQKAGVGDLVCEECTFVVAEVKNVLDDKSTQDQVTSYLRSLCKRLSSLESECDALVEQYVPILFQELDNYLKDPKQACEQLGLCHTKQFLVDGLRMFRAEKVHARHGHNRRRTGQLEMTKTAFSRLQTSKGFGASCLMCETSVNALLVVLKDTNQTMGSMAKGLQKQVCRMFPHSQQEACNDFLGTYLKPILVLVLNQASGKEICGALHVCSDYERRSWAEASPVDRMTATCEACEVVTEFLKYELRQPSLQKELVGNLEKVCMMMPEKDLCTQEIEQFFPIVIGILVERMDGACSSLRVCTN